jgi:hypothetical protein
MFKLSQYLPTTKIWRILCTNMPRSAEHVKEQERVKILYMLISKNANPDLHICEGEKSSSAVAY